MPLFEFECLDCAKRFEEIVLGNAVPRCPSCEGEKLRKLLSSFAVGNAASAVKSSSETPNARKACGDDPCGPGGPGSCSVN